MRRPSSGTMRGMGDESHLGLARIVAPGIHEHVAPRNPERRPFSDRRSHSQHLPAFREVDYAPILFFHLSVGPTEQSVSVLKRAVTFCAFADGEEVSASVQSPFHRNIASLV